MGLGVSASLGFYHSIPLQVSRFNSHGDSATNVRVISRVKGDKLRFFFIVLSVRARSELIVFVLLDELKRSREDYQLLTVAFALSMVNWVTDITI